MYVTHSKERALAYPLLPAFTAPKKEQETYRQAKWQKI